MHRLIALWLLCIGSAAAAQTRVPAAAAAPAPWTRPFLWRIEGAAPSYLFGTMHLPDERAAHFPPSVAQALESSQAVVLEISFGFWNQVKLGTRMVAPHGERAVDLAPPPLVARLRKLVEARHANWSTVEPMRLWAATMTLPLLLIPSHGGAILDKALSDWGDAHGKELDGLETVEEQVAIVDGLPPAQQLELFESMIESIERGEIGEDLREIYFSGDEQRALRWLRKERSDHRPASVALDQRTFGERNPRMAERIRARLADGKPRFYAVGLGHLIGPDGLVARLRRAGLKVTRVDSPTGHAR